MAESNATEEQKKAAAEAAAKAKAAEKARPPEKDATERLFEVIDPLVQVMFYEDGSTEVPGRPALIISKGSRTLTLLVLDTASQFGLYKRADGVRWHHDPLARPYEREQLGVFDLTPLGKRLLDLLAT